MLFHVKHKAFALLFVFFASFHVFAEDEITGLIEPVAYLELTTAISGVVTHVHINEGEKVSKDEAILTLDDRLQLLSVEEKQRAVKDQINVNTLEKKLRIVADKLASLRKLNRATGSVSKDELLELQVQYLHMQAELALAKEQEKKELIELNAAKVKLEQHVLRSPIDGVIAEIGIKAGEWANSGTILVKLLDSSTCYAEANVTEAQIQRLQQGKIKVLIQKPDELLEKAGILTFISPMADQASELILVRVEFDNQDGAATPGVTARIQANE